MRNPFFMSSGVFLLHDPNMTQSKGHGTRLDVPLCSIFSSGFESRGLRITAWYEIWTATAAFIRIG
jgi:hypothetical protein